MSSQTTATVRMYRLKELGDCFLVTFKAGDVESRMLIDCGSFRNGTDSVKRLEQITQDIHDSLKPHADADRAGVRLDVVVGTHQHNDHLSGYYHCKKTFDAMGVGQVWMSWLDDPIDPVANQIGNVHDKLRTNLSDAHAKLTSARGPVPQQPLETLTDILGAYGARSKTSPPLVPAEAVERLKGLKAKKPPRYLGPGATVDMPGLPKDTVRVHVLGPPRKHEQLYRANPRAGESYDHALTARFTSSSRFLMAVENLHGGRADRRDERDYPFTHSYKTTKGSEALTAMRKRYARSESWRRIDHDWLNQAETLALFLDTYTNNSSLALAIELVDSGRVLLFAADAQIGNWESWGEIQWERTGVTTDDLLARTVFYKVGHHASHNATLKPVLDYKMTHPDLCALISVHKDDPNIAKPVNPWRMPATNLYKALKDRTANRVLRMDGADDVDCMLRVNGRAWEAIGIAPKTTELFIELEFPGTPGGKAKKRVRRRANPAPKGGKRKAG